MARNKIAFTIELERLVVKSRVEHMPTKVVKSKKKYSRKREKNHSRE